MKQLLHTWTLGALALLSACVADEPCDCDTQPLTIRFTAESRIETRTTLVNSNDLQHVEEVYLYVFDGTGAEAPCIACEDVDWQQPTGETASQTYILKTQLNSNKTYTFLAVGLDPASAATYLLPAGPEWPLGGEEEIRLGNALAKLRTDKAQKDIATSELFAGTTQASVQGGEVEIQLKRRVAGVLGYFTNIPEEVTKIQLVLYADQRKEVPLMVQDPDFGTEVLGESTVLLDIPVTNEIKGDDQVYDETGSTVGEKAVGSVLKGAYVLPLPASTDGTTGTMRLELYGANDTWLRSYPVKLKENETAEPTEVFALEANKFYSIGHKDDTRDDPYDLGGTIQQEVYIYVDGNWQADVDIPM